VFDKNVSFLYPLSEIDAYSVDMFCTAETLTYIWGITTAIAKISAAYIKYTQAIFWLSQWLFAGLSRE